jgi:hypothetical protein
MNPSDAAADGFDDPIRHLFVGESISYEDEWGKCVVVTDDSLAKGHAGC